jgi:hypothetical protein
MENTLLDIYSGYLIGLFSRTTATGLSRLLDNAVSHDRGTRFLAGPERPLKPPRP